MAGHAPDRLGVEREEQTQRPQVAHRLPAQAGRHGGRAGALRLHAPGVGVVQQPGGQVSLPRVGQAVHGLFVRDGGQLAEGAAERAGNRRVGGFRTCEGR